ncbi:hypothetical protein B9Z55_020194 [Caenorhabditis nigoni]|uniref:Uncharacterized protein n=1 Tax=Caenorhabditis nigoni TaxID=1611254 RepID=A0A2G5TLQ1_9PELO|nr:hypothetical protein B9Z55_020194 [Caenorhabditis nigoni]
MSLYEPADGILETHVTWEDIESDLQEKLGTKATFGPNKKAVNISDLKGFMSRIALVEPDWQNVENGKELPQKFALKVIQKALLRLAKCRKWKRTSAEVCIEGYSKSAPMRGKIISREIEKVWFSTENGIKRNLFGFSGGKKDDEWNFISGVL